MSRIHGSLRSLKEVSGYYRLRGKRPRVSTDERHRMELVKTISKNVDLERPFVYFPLHLQPELTTSALGDEYRDQVLAIERLSRWVPADTLIYLKENPKQTHRWREPPFYERIRTLKNVRLLPTETNTYQLIEKSHFIATITGTVGWEATSGGKPVVVFGRPWYLQLRGVHPWHPTLEPLRVKNDEWTQDEFQASFDSLLEFSRPGIVDMNYTKAVENHDSAANSRFVAEFLKAQLVI
ncbi:MAG: hypothetical protein R3C03_02200 [Pirellulaceae bacterium]